MFIFEPCMSTFFFSSVFPTREQASWGQAMYSSCPSQHPHHLWGRCSLVQRDKWISGSLSFFASVEFLYSEPHIKDIFPPHLVIQSKTEYIPFYSRASDGWGCIALYFICEDNAPTQKGLAYILLEAGGCRNSFNFLTGQLVRRAKYHALQCLLRAACGSKVVEEFWDSSLRIRLWSRETERGSEGERGRSVLGNSQVFWLR